jgi:uncharacterized cupredoxin-like copper-binding protein
MKRITLLSAIVLIAIITTACGGSTPAATQAPAQPAVTQPPAQPASTEAPAQSTATEAPTQPAATDTAVPTNNTQVDITLADNTIKSSLTTFQVGVAYTFVITNTGRHAHNFNISTPASKAGSLENALATALLSVDQNQLGSGASATVEYTFPDSAVGAPLEFSCLIRRHYEDGMLLAITVTK